MRQGKPEGQQRQDLLLVDLSNICNKKVSAFLQRLRGILDLGPTNLCQGGFKGKSNSLAACPEVQWRLLH